MIILFGKRCLDLSAKDRKSAGPSALWITSRFGKLRHWVDGTKPAVFSDHLRTFTGYRMVPTGTSLYIFGAASLVNSEKLIVLW